MALEHTLSCELYCIISYIKISVGDRVKPAVHVSPYLFDLPFNIHTHCIFSFLDHSLRVFIEGSWGVFMWFYKRGGARSIN